MTPGQSLGHELAKFCVLNAMQDAPYSNSSVSSPHKVGTMFYLFDPSPIMSQIMHGHEIDPWF